MLRVLLVLILGVLISLVRIGISEWINVLIEDHASHLGNRRSAESAALIHVVSADYVGW